MSAKRPFHVACSPLTKRIYAGHISKDGQTWLEGKTDVSEDALFAVIRMLGPGTVTTVTAKDGSHAFEVEVRHKDLTSPAPEGDRP